MSLAALALVLGYVAVYGYRTSGQPQDEGAAAHLFQLLMVLQAAHHAVVRAQVAAARAEGRH